MTMTQYNAFEGEDWAAMSTAQFAALQGVTPIVLDLDGNGIRTLAASEGVAFDIDATGKQTQTGWVGGGDALLVRDINGNGSIDSGKELFGGATQLANGQRAGDGFRALAELDSNGDGKVNASDKAFGELKLWADADADGVTDAGELKGLLEMGVLELNLDFSKGTDMDNGNLLGLVGSYTGTDGTDRAMVDVWFAKAGGTPALGDLLAEAPAEMLGSGGSKAAAPATGAVAPGSLRSLDDEWLRNGGTPLI
jgi:hypothetical protein